MEKERLADFLRQSKMEEETICELLAVTRFHTYEAGETILEMGSYSANIGLILDGIVRGYYLDEEGRDITKCFSKEEEWCCCYNLFSEKPFPFSVGAVERVTIAFFPIAVLEQICEEHRELREWKDAVLREVFLDTERRVLSFCGMDAKQRYLSFVRENPELCRRMKQEYIASYLGITPSSLSRIKREL